MKTILKSFLCIVLCVAVAKEVLACCGGPLEGTNGIILRVEGMKTPEDADKVESVLKQSPGVMEAHVYKEKRVVAVTLTSSSIPEESLIRSVEKAGFSAFLPTNLNLNICSVDSNISPENLKNLLNEVPGITTRSLDFEHKRISIDIYKPWIRTAKRLIDVIEDTGYLLCLSKETLEFKLGNVSTVDAFDVRAYVQSLFGVISADLDIDKGMLKVVIYKELACTEDIVRTIKERGFIDA